MIEITDKKRMYDIGPTWMANHHWRSLWMESEGRRVAVVMWDTSIEHGTVIAAWIHRKEHPRVQVELDVGGEVIVHPRWVFVDWGGPDGRGWGE